MAYITPAQESLVRAQEQNTKLYLSIYQPDTVLACQVNDASISKGERSLTYDTVTSGNYLSVKAGMTLLVGTSSGSDDKGRIRVKSANDTTITIAENGDINWADDDYLTVINYFEINSVYPRIIQDPSDELNTLWYKDYDIAYTNQNNILGTMICMGSHYAGMLNGAGTHQVYYSATGTHNMFDESLSYHWVFEGADTTGSTSETPGWVTYSGAGHFTSTLIVSGTTNGAVDNSYRHVSIYERPENGINNPILNWEFNDFSGDRNKGGYTGKIKIHENIDSSILKNGSLVVIFNESWYNDNKNVIGGNGQNRGNIFFVGYVMSGTINYNYRESSVEFVLGSPSEVMKLTETYVIEVEDSTDPASEAVVNENHPTGWTLLKGMNLERSIYHYLRWHTTALNCIDFQYLGSDVNTQYFRSDLTSVFDTLNSTMNTANWGMAVCDRQGKVWFETPIWYSDDTSYFATNVGISSQDWMGDPSISVMFGNQTSFLNAGGVAWSGAYTGTYGAFLCDVPGTAAAYRGSMEKKPRLAVSSQTQLNTISGDYFAHINADYPDAFMTLRGGYLHYDIAPQEFVPVTVQESETVRGISFNDKNFYIRTMNYDYDPKSELLFPSISLVEHTSGFTGDTVIKPPVPTEGETGGSYGVPSFEIPPFPAIPSFNLSVSGGFDRLFCKADRGWDVGAGSELTWSGDDYVTVPDSSVGQFTHFFTVPSGCTSFSAYSVCDIRTTAGGVLALSYNWQSGLIQFDGVDDLRKNISDTNNITIPSSSLGKWIFSDVMTVNVGDGSAETRVYDAVRFQVTFDRSVDPPDTLTGNMGYKGLYVIFSF